MYTHIYYTILYMYIYIYIYTYVLNYCMHCWDRGKRGGDAHAPAQRGSNALRD